jgi:hypothetical protein
MEELTVVEGVLDLPDDLELFARADQIVKMLLNLIGGTDDDEVKGPAEFLIFADEPDKL